MNKSKWQMAKRAGLALGLCGAIAGPARAATNVVTFDLHSATATVTNRRVIVTPLNLRPGTGEFAVYDRLSRTSDVSGLVLFTNMTPGTYQASIQTPPDLTTRLFYVDSSNA